MKIAGIFQVHDIYIYIDIVNDKHNKTFSAKDSRYDKGTRYIYIHI